MTGGVSKGEHLLAQIALCWHEDALAMEWSRKPSAVHDGASRVALRNCWRRRPASSSVLVEARISSRRLIEGAERACSVATAALESESQHERASAAALRRSGRYSIAKSNLNSLLSH
jgi:hypothetical protein